MGFPTSIAWWWEDPGLDPNPIISTSDLRIREAQKPRDPDQVPEHCLGISIFLLKRTRFVSQQVYTYFLRTKTLKIWYWYVRETNETMKTWKRCTLGWGIARLFYAASWVSQGGVNRELLSKIHGKIVKENNKKNYFLIPKKIFYLLRSQ